MKRVQNYDPHIDEDGHLIAPDRDEVAADVLDLLGALDQLGGVLMVVPKRTEVAPDEFRTTGWQVRYDSFAPAQRQPKPAEVLEEPVEDPEPVGAEA